MSAGGVPADALGVVHPPAGEEARIVSLVPSLTELLFDLGLGPRVVGRTGFCVHPAPEVDKVRRVGGTKKVRLDRLRALEPTHVLVNIDENTREAYDAMVELVPHVVVTHPGEPLDNLHLYALLGELFDCRPAAETLAARLRQAHEALVEAARDLASRRVLYLIWRDPWMTVSPPTYISRTLALVNWHTVGGHPTLRYPPVDLPGPVLEETDLVLLSSEPFPFREQHLEELRMIVGPGIEIALIDGEMTSWYGSRAVAGLEYLAALAPRLESARAR